MKLCEIKDCTLPGCESVEVERADNILLISRISREISISSFYSELRRSSSIGALKGFFLRKLAIWELGVTVEIEKVTKGRRLNGFLGQSSNHGSILFLVILLDKTVSVG